MKIYYFHRRVALFMGLSVFSVPALTASNPSPEPYQLWPVIQEQQRKIEQLEQRLDMTADMMSSANFDWGHTDGGHGSSGKTILGGYGELHYNNLDSKKEIDFHRFVLFFGHEFSDRVRFSSELEIEHALSGEGQPGEVEIEQAFVEFDLNTSHTAMAGLFLVPAGILNETHEPPTFYGVERNPVEKDIIPTTWWEAGAGLSGILVPGLHYDVTVHSGLAVGTDFKVRGGRQKVAKAKAENLAYTGRIKWMGVPGVEVAATVQYQDDITQGQIATGGSATLLETHAVVNRGPVGVRVLYATWDLGGTGPETLGSDEQTGWYIEPSYKVTDSIGVFARYNEWDNNAGSSIDTKKKQTDVGINFWPHEDVVLKVDFMDQSGAATDDGFNLGVGYQF